MGVERGLVEFINQGLAGSPPVAIPPGGFMVMVPKDLVSASVPQAWSYRTVSSNPDYNLFEQTGWTEWKVQIDCHGQAGKDAIDLARRIERVMRGAFRGNFPDPDSTYVFGIFAESRGVDGYSDINRTFVRSLEYSIVYQQV